MILNKSFLLVIILFATTQMLLAQTAQDTSLVQIETSDGNEFIGEIVSEDSLIVILKTDKLGQITIPKNDIISRKTVNVQQIKDGKLWFDNPQATRYFWAPNGYGLKKEEGYYQNIYVLWNQFAYGVSDNFSIGGGVIPLFLFGGGATPVFITPKFSIPIQKDKFNIGGGALIGTVLGESEMSFGIVYGLTTIGTRDNNVSFSLGYGFAGGEWAQSPLVNVSGLFRVSSRFYFITENYYINTGGEGGALIGVGGRWIIKKGSFGFYFWDSGDSGYGNFYSSPGNWFYYSIWREKLIGSSIVL